MTSRSEPHELMRKLQIVSPQSRTTLVYLGNGKEDSTARVKSGKEGGIGSKVGVLDRGQIILGLIEGSGLLDVMESC